MIIQEVVANPGKKMMGRYQLLALLATGGMAEVYLAKQKGIKGFEKLVVVKRILPHLARESRFIEMFFDEARITAKLNHPNIIQTYDLGKEGNEYFIAMEYLEGESLGYLINRAQESGQLLPETLAAGIVFELCKGLEYAHKYRDESGTHLNIVHRDISPHNIFVMFSGGVKLVDFGIAKATTREHHTIDGSLKGKLGYMSPEQCLGKTLDARSDLFSLGVVLWELLARRRLFKRGSESAMIEAILREPIPRLREMLPNIPKSLDVIVNRALQKEPDSRYFSANEMGSDIKEYLREAKVAGVTKDIEAFVGKVLAERVMAKREALKEIENNKGTQFDPNVVDAFMRVSKNPEFKSLFQ